MTLRNNENPHDFVLRVEQKRAKYDINKRETFRAFKNVLPLQYWEKLDDAREFAVLFDEDTEIDVNWDTLVRRAKHATKSVRYGAGGTGVVIAGFDVNKKHVPPSGTAIVVPPKPTESEEGAHMTMAFR